MSKPAIEIEDLAKVYRVGVADEKHDTLAATAAAWLTSPLRNYRRLRKLSSFDDRHHAEDVIWALRDINLTIEQGEVVGIIGRNGAGKSTLLKILSRITVPTEGQARIHGRVGSLLEVGTGFHPDLTGRENVYLNGAILGMSKAEIDRKFDEIVAFSEVEDFIDTPTKRYSSGMQVRLAFSVAAHLEPEVLMIDEVLAVGDVAFQRKCLGRVGDIAQAGRTVLFVSHNMGAVESLCQRVVVLEDGVVAFDGDTLDGINHYLARNFDQQPTVDLLRHPGRRSGMTPTLAALRLLDDDGQETNGFRLDENIHFEVQLEPGERRYPRGALSIGIYNRLGQLVCSLKSDIQSTLEWRVDGPTRVRASVEKIRIVPGEYIIGIAFSDHRSAVDWIDDVTTFEIRTADVYGTGQAGRIRGGYVVPHVRWSAGDA